MDNWAEAMGKGDPDEPVIQEVVKEFAFQGPPYRFNCAGEVVSTQRGIIRENEASWDSWKPGRDVA